MKNLLTLILGLIIGAIIMYFYCCKSGDFAAPMVVVKPSGVISTKDARTLDRAFDSRHKLISDSIVKRPDNRSSWWSLKDMQDYLKYAENQSEELGYTMDGIRVYLGAYPDEEVDSKRTVGYTTMFMVPTSSEIEQVHQKGGSAVDAKDGGDVPGGDPLNDGSAGNPPSANYPQ
ncbi:hypothetical protein [Lacinutrix sp. Bg11-31]|uniref:hypothetical protein n=1 Tax=Lacinutrix sp. Bg11-31 TaxID=2057808 RepID=UPI000C304B0C|nr:hypothetical protein [Lacinutrix sp. Bg11-31]AUC81241.1 hypothetical protein CW733_03460 [Lacinutrix sp. Bg11-31]